MRSGHSGRCYLFCTVPCSSRTSRQRTATVIMVESLIIISLMAICVFNRVIALSPRFHVLGRSCEKRLDSIQRFPTGSATNLQFEKVQTVQTSVLQTLQIYLRALCIYAIYYMAGRRLEREVGRPGLEKKRLIQRVRCEFRISSV